MNKCGESNSRILEFKKLVNFEEVEEDPKQL